MRKILLLFAAAVLLLSLAACSHSDESTLPPVASGSIVVTPEAQIPTNIAPSIRGFITRINHSPESTELLVEYYAEDEASPDFSYDKALVKLDSNSAIATDHSETLAISSLTVGSTVEVWFSEPSTESYPVFAYGQAVRVITTGNTLSGASNLPQLTVSCGASAATIITHASWNEREYEFEPLKAQLDRILGAHLTISRGDTVTLSFNRTPRNVSACISSSTVIDGEELEVLDKSRIVIPEDTNDDVYIRVTAEFYSGTVEYAFALPLITSAD